MPKQNEKVFYVWDKDWPKKAGIYIFYGYPMNRDVDVFPRTLLVNVEYAGLFGWKYRTMRASITQATGAEGIWMKVFTPPELPSKKMLDALLKEEE